LLPTTFGGLIMLSELLTQLRFLGNCFRVGVFFGASVIAMAQLLLSWLTLSFPCLYVECLEVVKLLAEVPLARYFYSFPGSPIFLIQEPFYTGFPPFFVSLARPLCTRFALLSSTWLPPLLYLIISSSLPLLLPF